jgi:hypothetical protein
MAASTQEIPSLLDKIISSVKSEDFCSACSYYNDFVTHLQTKGPNGATKTTMLDSLTQLQKLGGAAAEGALDKAAANKEDSLGASAFRSAIVNDLIELEAFLQQVWVL